MAPLIKKALFISASIVSIWASGPPLTFLDSPVDYHPYDFSHARPQFCYVFSIDMSNLIQWEFKGHYERMYQMGRKIDEVFEKIKFIVEPSGHEPLTSLVQCDSSL